MNGTFSIKCKVWNDQERMVKDHELCETVGLLEDRASQRYGDPNVRRLRLDFLNGVVTFAQDRPARMAMESLLRLEDEFLSAYVLQVCSIARSFWQTNKRRKIDVDDFIQEGCLALSNAVYHYDGSTAFTTYLQHAIRRCLIAYAREQEELSGIGRGIKRLKKMAVSRMKQCQCSLEEAILYLQNQGEKISEIAKEKIELSFYSTVPMPEFDLKQKEQQIDLDVEAIQLCIHEAGLTEIEMELIIAYMEGNNKFRSEATRTRINQTTGRLYTKQALNLAFKRACSKIKDRLVERELATV